MKNIFLLLLLSTGLAGPAAATDFYLAANGSDANAGTSSALPWQTLAKLSAELSGPSGTNSVSVQPGDRIFFRRGDTFRGTVALQAFNNFNLTFDAYGAGALPILSGAVPVAGWTPAGGGVWQATLAQPVQYLYAGGQLQTLARYPNTGYLYATASTGTSVEAPQIQAAGLNFDGASACLRENDYTVNRQVVTATSGSRVQWGSAIGAPTVGANFYFDNKRTLLDAATEWYYDGGTQTLYYQPAAGTDPNTLALEACVAGQGFRGIDNRSGITIQNLDLRYYAEYGIRLPGASDNVRILNNRISHTTTALVLGGAGGRVWDNAVTDSYRDGLVLVNLAGGSASRNTVRRTGTRFGLNRPGFTGGYYTSGIDLIFGGMGAVIDRNLVEDAGYVGIRFNGSGVLIEKNVINNTLLNMADGGAIYCFGPESNTCTIRDNFINNVVGDHNGSPGGIALGVYFDNASYGHKLLHNTVADVSSGGGILVNAGSYGHTIRQNTTYNCTMTFADWQAANPIINNRVARNTFYSLHESQAALQLTSTSNRWNMLSADSNAYCNPFSRFVASRGDFGSSTPYALPAWQALYPGGEAHSFEGPLRGGSRAQLQAYTGAELLPNGTFDANTTGWASYAEAGAYTVTWDNAAGLTDGSLRFVHTSTVQGFVVSPTFTYTNGQWYKLNLTVKSVAPQTLLVDLQRAYGNYASLQRVATVGTDATVQSFEVLFQATVSEAPANLIFRTAPNNPIWLDNMSLRAVTVTLPDPKLTSRLYPNPSDNPLTVSLPAGVWQDVKGQPLGASITVPAWSSIVAVKVASAPLPVVLVAFTAERQGEAARLAWATASEQNSAYFEVQASADGRTFRPLDQVAAAGSSLTRRDYAYLDAGLPDYGSPLVYYRLRQVDLDGRVAYSPVRVVAANGTGLSVYPSPAHDYLLVRYPAAAGGPAELRNALGQLVRRVALLTPETVLDLRGLTTGVYTLHLTLDGQSVVRRVVVE